MTRADGIAPDGPAKHRRWRLVSGVKPPIIVSVAILVCVCVVSMAILGSILAPHSASSQDLGNVLVAPSSAHWFGTDDLGRDVLSRTIVGARTALIGPSIVAVALLIIGSALGVVAGYRGGLADAVISRWCDFMIAVPPLVVMLVIVGILGGGYYLGVALLCVFSAPYDTRVIRSAVLAQRSLPYVEAARTTGLSQRKIMAFHIFPVISPLLLAMMFANFAWGIVNLSALSFLGVGVSPGTPDWGRMLAEDRVFVFSNPTISIAPALMIVATAVSMNLVGDWIHEGITDRGRAR